MTTRHEQIIESLLRQILEGQQRANLALYRLVRLTAELEEDVDEIEADVDDMVPEPGAVSATLVITPN